MRYRGDLTRPCRGKEDSPFLELDLKAMSIEETLSYDILLAITHSRKRGLGRRNLARDLGLLLSSHLAITRCVIMSGLGDVMISDMMVELRWWM